MVSDKSERPTALNLSRAYHKEEYLLILRSGVGWKVKRRLCLVVFYLTQMLGASSINCKGGYCEWAQCDSKEENGDTREKIVIVMFPDLISFLTWWSH